MKLKLILIGIVSLMLLINGVSSLSIKNTKLIERDDHKKSSIFDDNTEAKNILPRDIFNKQKREEPEFVQGELIVKFESDVKIRGTMSKNGITKTGISSVDRLNEKHNIYSIEKVFKNIKTDDDIHGLSYFYKFTFPKNKNVLVTAEEYKRDTNVEYAGPNYIMKTCLTPNDPYYTSSGGWGQDFQDLYGLHLINVSGAWDVATGNHDVIVAVIDTGVDYNHEDIADNMWINEDDPENGIDDDNDGFIDNIYGADIFYNDSDPMDRHGHGTHCAGTIAAVGNNSLGVVGVNWQVKIMAVKALNDGGSAGISSLAGSLVWAADNGADVLSNSWGSEYRWPSEPTIEAAIRYAYDKGCVIVFAAGNSEDDVRYYCPQNMAETIAVAATDHQDEMAIFTNFGELIDVCAPGVEILSLRANDTDFYHNGYHIVDDDYYYASGTSMACPHVAGLAALLLSKNYTFDKDTIRTIIEYSVDEVDSPEYLGRGRINASKALQRPPAAIRLGSFANPTDVKGLINVEGSAWGEYFEYYLLEYGRGQNTASWTTIINSTNPVQDDILATIDTTLLDEGFYAIRLHLTCSDNVYEKITWMVVNNEFNTLIVDDDGQEVDYTSIQEAVDDAGHNDLIYVCNGTYNERVTVRKTISLQGESKENTIIDGSGGYSVISVYSNNINISRFTIQNSSTSGAGIRIDYDLTNADSCIITDNIIKNTGNGIYIGGWSNWGSSQNNIFGNDIINNSYSGIYLRRGKYNTIVGNTINNDNYGILLYSISSNNNISENTFTNNDKGILFNDLPMTGYNNNNSVFCNTFSQNNWGIYLKNTLFPSDDNSFYHNNFFENNYNAYDACSSQWDNGCQGNYWSDYIGGDANGDGIGDTPYEIPGGNSQDRYPFMNQDGWTLPNWWPMFRHDCPHSGFSTSTAPNTNNTIWEQTISSWTISSPAVVDNKIYIGDGGISCRDAATGNVIWANTDFPVEDSSPAVANDKVYIGSVDGNLYCLHTSNGTKIWDFKAGCHVWSSPTVVNDRVYIGSWAGVGEKNVFCLDADTGAEIWNFTMEGGTKASSPAVVDGYVYIGSYARKLYCLNASDGTEEWNYSTDGLVFSTPAVSDGRVYVGGGAYLYCIDAELGILNWESGAAGVIMSSPAVAYGNVYAGSGSGIVYCFNTTTGIEQWSYSAYRGVIICSPAVADGKVYIGTMGSGREIYCLNTYTGDEIWNYTAGGGVQSSPAIVNGKVYVASTDGNLYAFGD